MTDQGPDEITEQFAIDVLEAVAKGPIGAAILGLARGEMVLTVKPLRNRAGWRLEVEPADQADAPLDEQSDARPVAATPRPEIRLSDPARDWCPNVGRLSAGPKATVCAGCSPGPCQLSTGGMDRF